MYFKSRAAEVIFYLVELDGKARMDKLGITMKHYCSKKEAEKWYQELASAIAGSEHEEAPRAMAKLNEIHEDMIGVGK